MTLISQVGSAGDGAFNSSSKTPLTNGKSRDSNPTPPSYQPFSNTPPPPLQGYPENGYDTSNYYGHPDNSQLNTSTLLEKYRAPGLSQVPHTPLTNQVSLNYQAPEGCHVHLHSSASACSYDSGGRYRKLNKKEAISQFSKSEIRCRDEDMSSQFEVEMGSNHHYINCKKGVTGKDIREYQRQFHKEFSVIESQLFQFAISALEKRKSFWNYRNTELRIYSNDPQGYNPVFYSGTRSSRCIVIWQEGSGPEFIEINRHWWSSIIPPGFFIKFMAIFILFTLLAIYSWFMLGRLSQLLVDVSQKILATIKIEGNSVSEVNLDALDINIHMLTR